MSDQIENQNLHKITLNTGRMINLQKITLTQTYEGVLEGDPMSINWKVSRRAFEGFAYGKEPILILPDSHNYLLTFDSFEKAKIERERQRGWRLPDICCAALFQSDPCDPADFADWSVAAIVWFQDSFSLQLDEATLEKIKAIDWDANGVDCGF